MIYNILVTITNSPTKVKRCGYLISAESEAEAVEKALERAKEKANKPLRVPQL